MTHNPRKMRALAKLQFDERRHRYSLGGIHIPNVTTILQDLSPFSGMPSEVLEEARQRGNTVHLLTAIMDGDHVEEHPTHPGDWGGYLRAWDAFKQATGFTPVHIEQRVFHTSALYVGTLDRVGWLDGRLVVVDIKTGVIQPEAALQTAAYQAAWNEGVLTDKVTGRYCVQVKNDGTYRMVEFKDRGDYSVFISAMQVHLWRMRNG